MKENILLKLLLSICLLMLLVGCATTGQTAKEPVIKDDFAVISDITVQDNSLEISSNKHFVYTMYTANDPYKISIDIPDMRTGNYKNKIVSDKAGITEVIPQQTDSGSPAARIDVVLQTPSSVTPVYKDNTLKLMFRHEEPAVKNDPKETARETTEALAALLKEVETALATTENAAGGEKDSDTEKTFENDPAGVAPSAAPATEVSSIRLKKSGDGVKIIINGNGTMIPNVFPVDERIVVDMLGVAMKASVPSSMISPLKSIRAGKHKDKVRLVFDFKEKTTFDVAAVGNSIEVSLKRKEGAGAQASAGEILAGPVAKESAAGDIASKEPVVKETKPAGEPETPSEGKYKGKKISLDFQDAEIGPIFRLLADVEGYNLVLDPAVKGKYTLKLMNVPWDQALNIVLNQTHFSHRIDGNILWIAPSNVFDTIVTEKAKTKETAEKAEDLVQEIVRVNYATSGDLSSAITQGKLLSPRGSITIDSRMNTLIIKDTQKSIDKIKELVKIMDVTKPQVMIEAKLVQVSNDYKEQLGIRWGGSVNAQTWPNTFGGNFAVNTPTIAGGPDTTIPGGTAGFTVGNANNFKVSMSLSALESIGKSKTLSNPKVLTMDNESATIQQGRTFFIETVSQAGTQTTQQQATLSLTVTPKITPDGYVQLKVNATDNSLEAGTSGANAVVDTKSLTTQALVKNGETLVLGGIYTQDTTEISEGIPLLGRIPGLGWLFKTKNTQGPNVKELLIFITPTIVTQPQ